MVADDFKIKNWINGKITETLVEDLLKHLGYKVFRTGYENKYQEFINLDSGEIKDNDERLIVRISPDFMVITPSDKAKGIKKEIKFIEVKFYHNTDYYILKKKIESLAKFYPYTLIILLTNIVKDQPFQACYSNEFKGLELKQIDLSKFKDLKEFIIYKKEDVEYIEMIYKLGKELLEKKNETPATKK